MPPKQKATITPTGSKAADEEISNFLSCNRLSEKERKLIDTLVREMNRVKPINAMDERLMQKRVSDILHAAERKLKHFHLFTKCKSHHGSKKYKAIRSFITN